LVFFWEEVFEKDNAGQALQRRLQRLFWPYLAWTLIYITARICKMAIAHGPWPALLRPDSLAHFFLAGGGAVQLYFLPLLGVALCLAFFCKTIVEWGLRRPWLFGLFSVVIAAALPASAMIGERPSSSTMVSIYNLYINWIGWMAPFVFVAAGLARWRRQLSDSDFFLTRRYCLLGWGLLSTALVVNIGLVLQWLPYAWRLHSFGLAVLMVTGLSLLPTIRVSSNVCNYILNAVLGVFLMHHLFIEMFEWIGSRVGIYTIHEYDISRIIVMSGVVFIVSVVFHEIASRYATARFFLFGR
jgi:hypothetical protein